MAKKQSKIKLNFKKDLKDNILIFNEDYITNGNWLFNADYVEIDDMLIQNNILNKKYFQYEPIRQSFSYEGITKLSQLLPKSFENYEELTDTKMLSEINEKHINRIFYSKNKRYFSYMNNKYFNFINNLLGDFKFMQSSKFSAIIILNKNNNEIVGLIMPCRDDYCFIENKLYCFDLDVSEKLSQYEELKDFEIK